LFGFILLVAHCIGVVDVGLLNRSPSSPVVT
jgi:hypothetical protein